MRFQITDISTSAFSPGLGIHSFALSLVTLSLKIAPLKERPWAIRSLQKSDKSKLLLNKEWREWFTYFLDLISLLLFHSFKKCAICSKTYVVFIMFLTVAHFFFHFSAQERFVPARHSLLRCSFLKFCTMGLGAIHSWKRVNGYFALSLTKKRAIRRKNQRANSQPCFSLSL